MPLTPQELQPRLEGVFGFPVTPFHPDGSLNLDALQRHVSWMKGTGVHAIFVCGGTGEFFNLAPEEFQDAVAAAVEAVDGALPVVAGCGYSTAIARRFARAAEEAGADGLLLLPPYLIQPEQEGLYRHVREVAESVGLGVLLYHRDNALYGVRTVARLAELPNVVGFKDGHGNLEQFGRMVLEMGDRLAYMNGMPTAEMTFPSFYALGCRGYSSALSNFAPHVTLRFYRAVLEGDSAAQREILAHAIEPICRVRDLGKGYAVSYVKAAVNLLGSLGPEGAGPVRPPLVDLPPDHLAQLRQVLEAIRSRFPG
ncbi:MAG: 5-dehydro-4-deoxyglucarate dehydratase [Armatimonadota bacterium]